MRQLLRAGAKPELTDMEGKPAIDYADAAGFDEAVEQLERIAATAVPTAATTAPSPPNLVHPSSSAGRAATGPAAHTKPRHRNVHAHMRKHLSMHACTCPCTCA